MTSDDRTHPIGRIGLVATLLLAIGFGLLFFRSGGGDWSGVFIGAEALSIVALALLLTFRKGGARLAALGVTFVAAFIPTCEGVAIAHFPGGSPGPAPPSSVPLVLANLAVMVLAAVNFRDDDRLTMKIMLVITALVVVAIGACDLVYR